MTLTSLHAAALANETIVVGVRLSISRAHTRDVTLERTWKLDANQTMVSK